MAERVRLGTLAVDFTGDSAEFVRATRTARKQANDFRRSVRTMRRDMRRLRDSFRGLASSVRRVGTILAGAVAGLAAVTKSAADFGAELLENARLTGLTVEQYQNVRRLLQGDGLNYRQAQQALQRFNDVLSDALQGRGEGLRVFEQLGIDPRSIQGTLDGLLRVSNAIRNLSPEERLAIGSDLFGLRGARAILPLSGGAEAVEEQLSFFERLLESLTEAETVDLKALAQDFTNLFDQFATTGAKLIAEHADSIGDFINEIIERTPAIFDRVRDAIRRVIDNFEELKDLLISLGTAYAASKIVPLLSSLITAVRSLSTVTAGAATAPGGVAFFASRAFLGPIVAAVAAILGINIVVDALQARESDRQAQELNRIRGLTSRIELERLIASLGERLVEVNAEIEGLRGGITPDLPRIAQESRRSVLVRPRAEQEVLTREIVEATLRLRELTQATKETSEATEEVRVRLLDIVPAGGFAPTGGAPGLSPAFLRRLGIGAGARLDTDLGRPISNFEGLRAVLPGLGEEALERLRVGARSLNEMTASAERLRMVSEEVGRTFANTFDQVAPGRLHRLREPGGSSAVAVRRPCDRPSLDSVLAVASAVAELRGWAGVQLRDFHGAGRAEHRRGNGERLPLGVPVGTVVR